MGLFGAGVKNSCSPHRYRTFLLKNIFRKCVTPDFVSLTWTPLFFDKMVLSQYQAEMQGMKTAEQHCGMEIQCCNAPMQHCSREMQHCNAALQQCAMEMQHCNTAMQ